MAEVTINYKDAAIATMDASGTKTLQTQGKYCEDDIEVVYARPSGGTISTSIDAIKAYLESNGFVCSEFAVQTPESGEYFEVSHSLGRVPELVLAFNKDLHIENTMTGYQLGCVSNGNYGVDNVNNRTYQCSNEGISKSLIYTECLKNFPLSIGRTLYNFCRAASASSVSLRNGGGNSTRMIGTNWILAVK